MVARSEKDTLGKKITGKFSVILDFYLLMHNEPGTLFGSVQVFRRAGPPQ